MTNEERIAQEIAGSLFKASPTREVFTLLGRYGAIGSDEWDIVGTFSTMDHAKTHRTVAVNAVALLADMDPEEAIELFQIVKETLPANTILDA